MTRQEKVRRDFMIDVRQDRATPDAILVHFTPRELMEERKPGGATPHVPPFLVRACLQGEKIVAEWVGSPPEEYKANREDLEKEAADRLFKRVEWLRRLAALVDLAQGWANDLEWSTRRIQKEIKDSEIGAYPACALLMQEGTTRALLEPIGRSTPGSEGVVDLYLLPAYDDIASLLYYDGRWNLHYLSPDAPAVGDIRKWDSKPLSKAALRKVLDEMKEHVA
jgi:hypothetical protein